MVTLESPLGYTGEAGQAGTAFGVAQLAQTARLNLADALTGDAKALSDLIERLWPAVFKAEAQFDHFAITWRQAAQHFVQPFSQQVQIHFPGRIRCGRFG